MNKPKLIVVLALTICMFAATARADTIQIALGSDGAFSGPGFLGGWSWYGWSLAPLVAPLTYSAGFPINQLTDSAGNLPLTNLGTLTLGNVDGSMESIFGSRVDPYVFTLSITFTAPPGSGGRQFAADLDSVLRTGNITCVLGCIENPESVIFDFNNNPIQVNYSGGSFMLSVNDLEVYESYGPYTLTGQITNATVTAPSVPEPGSFLLLGAALVGLGFFLRRKAT